MMVTWVTNTHALSLTLSFASRLGCCVDAYVVLRYVRCQSMFWCIEECTANEWERHRWQQQHQPQSPNVRQNSNITQMNCGYIMPLVFFIRLQLLTVARNVYIVILDILRTGKGC